MLKKVIEYVDFDDKQRTETFYFNLTKIEVAELELSTDGGLVKKIEKVVAEENLREIFEIFKDLIRRSYGEKSPDGKRFIKSKELSEAFMQTEAYSVLFMELSTNAEEALAFVNGIIPNVPNTN